MYQELELWKDNQKSLKKNRTNTLTLTAEQADFLNRYHGGRKRNYNVKIVK